MTDKPRVRIPATLAPRSTSDSLTNMVANLGTGRDKRTHSFFGYSGVSQFELELAYQGNWLARRIVDGPNEDATREWRTFVGEEAKEIQIEEKRLSLQQHFQDASCWADLYGGAVIVMVTPQIGPQPLDVSRIKKGDLKRLIVLDRWDVSGINPNYFDPTAANFMLPESYVLVGGTAQIHHSHVIRLSGQRIPRRLRSIEQGWGDSRLRRCMEDLRDMAATKGGIASLVLEANVDVVTRKGLADDLGSSECDAITRRYQLFGMMKSMVNMALLDGDAETFERKSLSFSGLSQIMEQFMVWLSGAAQMPVTKLFGQSASGLNATGEGDMKNYYDQIKAKQDGDMRLQLEQLDQVLIRSAIGRYPADLEFEWNPLYQSSGVEQAQQDLADAQTDAQNLENKTIKVSMAMRRMQARGTYDITDEDIDAQIELEKDMENGEFDPEGGELADFTAGATEGLELGNDAGSQESQNQGGRTQ